MEGPVPNPGLPEYTPGPGNPEVPEPDKHWFCGKTAGSWDPELWRDRDIGRWLVQR